MSSEIAEDDFQTPNSNSKKSNLSLKRKSCPANLEKKAKSDLGTPLNTSSASCGRLHRLTESQKAQLRQRRLEFRTTNAENTENSDISGKEESAVGRETSMTKDDPAEFIKKAEEELMARETHERKVKELTESIKTWKNGLNRVLIDLQNKLPTHPNKRTILEQLRVPLNILEYVDDPDD